MKRKHLNTPRLQPHLRIELRSWGYYIDEAYKLQALLTKRPSLVAIEFVGTGEMPSDPALLMRSMILKRSARTRLVTNARSSLQGASVLLWLLGDQRFIRDDARLYFRPAGPFVDDKEPIAWKDCEDLDPSDTEEEDYVRVLHAINEFLPVKELAGRQIELPVMREFGLIDNERVDGFLATAFGRLKARAKKPRNSRPNRLVKCASA